MFNQKEWIQFFILMLFSVLFIIWIIQSNTNLHHDLKSQYYPVNYYSTNKPKSKLMETLYSELSLYESVFSMISQLTKDFIYLPKNILLRYINK
jgi:hypothetical protein